MKTILIFTFTLLLFHPIYSQDPEEILEKSFDACDSLRNGYYEMDRWMKYGSSEDTGHSFFTAYFKNYPMDHDKHFSADFYSKAYYKNKLAGAIYNSSTSFITANYRDSSATLYYKPKWNKHIHKIKHNFRVYDPFISSNRYPMTNHFTSSPSDYEITYLGSEVINKEKCYVVLVSMKPKKEKGNTVKTLSRHFQYWITENNYLPVQYVAEYKLLMGKDTQTQYSRCLIKNYQINIEMDSTIFQEESIPSYFKKKEHIPYIQPKLLLDGELTPNFILEDIHGDSINLNDLKGKVVLIDFFYKSCAPCVQAVPTMQKLHNKFKNKDVVIIGINPLDKKEDFTEFLKTQGISYPILLGNRNLAKKYRVSSYPTVYILDKNGKIVFSEIGYGKESGKKYKKAIKQALK